MPWLQSGRARAREALADHRQAGCAVKRSRLRGRAPNVNESNGADPPGDPFLRCAGAGQAGLAFLASIAWIDQRRHARHARHAAPAKRHGSPPVLQAQVLDADLPPDQDRPGPPRFFTSRVEQSFDRQGVARPYEPCDPAARFSQRVVPEVTANGLEVAKDALFPGVGMGVMPVEPPNAAALQARPLHPGRATGHDRQGGAGVPWQRIRRGCPAGNGAG